VPGNAKGKLKAVRGAVAYNAAAEKAAAKKGWAIQQDQWVVGTAQDVAALSYARKAR